MNAPMTTTSAALQRLHASRAALVAELNGCAAPSTSLRDPHEPDARSTDDAPTAIACPPQPDRRRAGSGSWLIGLAGPVAAQTLRLWWQRQPAYMVGQMARPLLDRAVQQRPVTVLAVSALAGAAIVWLKPWKRLPVAALMAAAVQAPSLSNLTEWAQQRVSPHK